MKERVWQKRYRALRKDYEALRADSMRVANENIRLNELLGPKFEGKENGGLGGAHESTTDGSEISISEVSSEGGEPTNDR